MNEFQHRISKQVRILAIVEAPRHFVKVSRQMLHRDALPEVPSSVCTGPEGLSKALSDGEGSDTTNPQVIHS